MILHMRCGNIVIFLFTFTSYLQINYAEESDSGPSLETKDEESNLKQAIFLVKLLRKEYSKVLLENELLRIAARTTAAPLTCPTIVPSQHIPQDTRYYRRQLPDDAYNESVARQEPFNMTNDIIEPTTLKTLAVATELQNTQTTKYTDTITTPQKIIKHKHIKSRNANKKRFKRRKHNYSSTTVEPVLKEVAMALLREMKDEQKVPSKISNVTTEKRFSKKRWARKSTKVPTTLRLHLDRSSRYHIPFPVNHAFCYTNPDNALCRTLI